MNTNIKTINKYLISDNKNNKLCKIIFKILGCNVLWIININNSSLDLVATDCHILDHYLEKKYYLYDPNISLQINEKNSSWQITLGSDCRMFSKNGFLYDLYKIFNVEEFVSIDKKSKVDNYCFRFFTKNNRFVFMNHLINNMVLIKYFINFMSKTFKLHLNNQSKLGIIKLE